MLVLSPSAGLWGQFPHTVCVSLASFPPLAVTCWALPTVWQRLGSGGGKESLAPGGLWQMAQVLGPLRLDRCSRAQ